MGTINGCARDNWNSQLGFVLAAIGSAIGLGNVWRFSYMAYDNGGGAFLIPYFVALLTTGIPLLILEFGLGHRHTGSAPLAFARISRRWEWLGWWAVFVVMFGIVLYYSVIISWCLNYLLLSLSLGWGDDPNTFFFQQFLGEAESPQTLGGIRLPIFIGLVIVWLGNGWIVLRGVNDGIELANKIFMPLLFLLTAVLVFWSLGLEGAGLGLDAYLSPDFNVLSRPKVWLDAFSQIFFTLSLGFGIMIAYASYLPPQAKLVRHASTTALINCGFSIFAGLAVFALLGHMAATTATPMKDLVRESIGLAFVAYPKAIAMLPFGELFGVLFFAALVVAGLSSSVSIVEAFTCAVIDKFGWRRQPVVVLICFIGVLGGLVFTARGGLSWLDIVDHFLSHYGLVAVGLGEALLVGWLFNIDSLRRHISDAGGRMLGRWWVHLVRFFVPLVLMVLLAADLIDELVHPYGDYSWRDLAGIGVTWLGLTLAAAVWFAWLPWRNDKPQPGNP